MLLYCTFLLAAFLSGGKLISVGVVLPSAASATATAFTAQLKSQLATWAETGVTIVVRAVCDDVSMVLNEKGVDVESWRSGAGVAPFNAPAFSDYVRAVSLSTQLRVCLNR